VEDRTEYINSYLKIFNRQHSQGIEETKSIKHLLDQLITRQ